MTMFGAVSHMGLWVRDQDEAKSFYTEKLGFEPRDDVALEEMGGYRWLTVGLPGEPGPLLILSRPGPPAFDEETAEQLLALAARGAMGGGILHSEDCRATCRELEGRGVELTQQPEERFYGVDASFRDPTGNSWRVVQPVEFDVETLQRVEQGS